MNLSYNLSLNLKNNLKRIELLRQKILIYPIPPSLERKLVWDAKIAKIFWSLSLAGNNLTKTKMEKVLLPPVKKRPPHDEKQVRDYNKALNFIMYDWKITPNTITPEVVLKLYNLACKSTVQKEVTGWAESSTKLGNLLDYLQTGNENPVVQAAIIQIEVIKLNPFPGGNGRVARLLALLFLYKYGYDVREMVVLSEYFRRDLAMLERVTTSTIKRDNLTFWIEYYAEGIEGELTKILKKIQREAANFTKTKAFWMLNQRQRAIMNLLEQPGSTVTNIQLRKMYRLSHMSIRRDLSKLARLGLIIKRGHGRAIHYARV